MFSLLRSINVLLFATIPASFLFIFVFSIQMIAYGKIAVGWIWTVDLWRRKRPLIHNKYTIFEMKNKVLLHDSSKTLVSHCFFGLLNQLPEHYWMFYLQIAGFKPRTSIWWQTLCPWLWLGRAVTSDSTSPQFKSSYRQKCYWTFTVNCIVKTKIKIKEAGKGRFKQHLACSAKASVLL